MAERPLDTPLSADLPEDWSRDQIIAPHGADAGLSEQHGYNYLMASVNAATRAINTLNEGFDGLSDGEGITMEQVNAAIRVAVLDSWEGTY